MDSKQVAKALKAEVFPTLREAGFSDFKSRTAWRHSDQTIAVVDFKSLGSYLGSALDLTSHSFCASAGVYYKALHATPWSKEPLPTAPEEWRCQARKALRKHVFQFRCWRPDVWYVHPSGGNLASVMEDVRRAVRGQALPWLGEIGDPERALRAFESREESEMRPGIALEVLGGRLDSFARAETASALALAVGDPERARAAWRRVLASAYYRGQGELRGLAEQRLALL